MAQKLALALVALFGVANTQIAVGRGGAIVLGAPAVGFRGLSHDDDDHHEGGPVLGHEVVLGRPVHLGEEEHHEEEHDDEPRFEVLNFAHAAKRDEHEGKRHSDDAHKDEEDHHEDKKE